MTTWEELTELQKIAAWHGLATNKGLSTTDRLQCALNALELYETHVSSDPPAGRAKEALDAAQRTGELIRTEMRGYRKAIVDLRRAAARDSCYQAAADELERQLGDELERQLDALETLPPKENE